MSKKQSKEGDPTPKRGTRFVPAEDVPLPGMSQRARELVALALCGFSLYAMLSLSTFRKADLDMPPTIGGMLNLGGAVGYHLAHGFTRALGLAGWIPFLLLLAYAILLFLGRSCQRATIKVLGAVVFAAMMAILFAGRDGVAGMSEMTPYGAGGVFGYVVSPKLEAGFGGTGRLLLVGFGALVSLLIATEWMFSQLLLRAAAAMEPLWRRVSRRPAAVGVGEIGLEEAPEAAEEPASRRASRKRTRVVRDPDDDEESEVDAGAVSPTKRRAAATTAVEPSEVDELDEDGSEDGVADAGEHEDGAAPRRASRVRSRSRRRREMEDEEEAEAQSAVEVGADADAPDGADAEPDTEPGVESVAESEPEPEPARKLRPVVVVRPRPKRPKAKRRPASQSNLPFQDYPFPPIELFQEPQLNDLSSTSETLQRGGEAIVNKLAHFNIESEIVAASVGPAVTQYELRLAESIRVNKVVGFESDLAAALRAISVRVVAPIPGKDTIGIEVPNEEREKVYMRDLLDMFGRADDQAIPLFLGKDVAGTPIVEDLARMPHLLIAGTTGSGKSVCINTILLSILMTRTPQQVKLILVDPKMVELQAYKRVPHLCCDVVTNMKKAPGVLQWAVDEMENRYALLSAAGVNHIKNYNRLGQQELAKRLQREPDPERVHLSYIVIVIDEFADLMNVAANEVEDLIQRLAQKSRAVGMHVILATQRPSSDVITGIIKANLPCQVAFKVNRRIDSRVILDANGAEKLLGFGDMLYMPPSGGALLRAQGTFVADDELQAVVRFLEEQGQVPSFNPALVQSQSSSRPKVADRDERYREAVEVVLGQQRGSATLLQRALAVGYTRATRLLELMEEDGLVGPFVGSKSRDVLLTLEEYQVREEQSELDELAAEEDGDYDEDGYEDADEDSDEEDAAPEDDVEANDARAAGGAAGSAVAESGDNDDSVLHAADEFADEVDDDAVEDDAVETRTGDADDDDVTEDVDDDGEAGSDEVEDEDEVGEIDVGESESGDGDVESDR